MKLAWMVCGSRWRPADSAPYEEALRSAGIEPARVRPQDSIPEAKGLLLIGGDDVNPQLYGEEPAPQTERPDDARDALECKLIEACLDQDLPIFGICRGLQILNVQQGGSLVQHLATTVRHRRRTKDRGTPAHSVIVEPGTLLSRIVSGTLPVNSRHHQAIQRLGSGLRVSAIDPEDHTIEAIERPDRRFCLAVQWHPENQSPTDPRQAALFQAFAAAL